MGETIFMVEEHDDGDWGDLEPSPPAAPVKPASTTLADGPNITSSMTRGPHEPEPAEPGGDQATVEGIQPLQGTHHDTFNIITHLNR
jgi:hypothetical protein